MKFVSLCRNLLLGLLRKARKILCREGKGLCRWALAASKALHRSGKSKKSSRLSFTVYICISFMHYRCQKFNKIYKQMRQILNKSQAFHPLKSPDIDRSKSKPLAKTQAPINQILAHCSQLKKFNTTSLSSKPQQPTSVDRTNSQLERQTIDLWISKYEYVKRDNQLLQSQIVYLNEHINCLTTKKKAEQMDFSKFLNQISKVFMQQIVQCQAAIKSSVDILEEKLMNSQEQVRKLKLMLADTSKKQSRPKCLDFPLNCQFQELFQTKIQNTKLSARIKVLQQQIKELGTKYLTNFQWKLESTNFFNQLQRKIFDKSTFSLKSNSKSILTNFSTEKQKISQEKAK